MRAQRLPWMLALSLVSLACRGPSLAEDAAPSEDPDSGSPTLDAGVEGVDASDQSGCDSYVPRRGDLELLIGPDGFEDVLLARIDAAKESVEVLIYQLTRDSFIDAFLAAHDRGVTVRILVDREEDVNDKDRERLEAGGVEVRDSPASFTHSHSKVILIDRNEAIILSGNLSTYTMTSERNYGVIDRDPEDIADVASVFDADWTGAGYPDLACTRLLVSPVNSRARLLALINRAKTRLDLAVMYLADDGILAAVKQRRAAGVEVRVLLSDPGWIEDNRVTAADLAAAGVTTRYLTSIELHAKLILADGIPFVGSENMSFTSLNRNREVGVIVTETGPAAAVAAQFEDDWDDGIPAP